MHLLWPHIKLYSLITATVPLLFFGFLGLPLKRRVLNASREGGEPYKSIW